MNHHTHPRTPVWRLVLGGMLAGTAFYFFPFLWPVLGFVALAWLFFRVVGGPRRRLRHAMAWEGMTDEQRSAMRERFRSHGCVPRHMRTAGGANPTNA